jgi:transcriptional regulator with XRE-family HTH domain
MAACDLGVQVHGNRQNCIPQQRYLFDPYSRACDAGGMEFKDRLVKAREQAQLTQEQLATAVGMKQQSLAALESGKSKSSRFTAQLAERCGVSPTWLASGKGPMAATSQPAGSLNEKTRASVEVLLYTLGNLGKPLEMVSDMDLLEEAYRIVDADGRDLSPAVKLDLNQKLAKRIREKEADHGVERGPSEGAGGAAGKPHPRRRSAGKA